MRLGLIQKLLSETTIANWSFMDIDKGKAHLVMSGQDYFLSAYYDLNKNSDFVKVIQDICNFPKQEKEEDIQGKYISKHNSSN